MVPSRYQAMLDALIPPSRMPPASQDATTWMATAPGFAGFSVHDFQRRRRLHPDVAWEGACRAYALAAATHRHVLRTPEAEAQLEAAWERLRGEGGPDWPVARAMMREAWRWLDAQSARMH